MRRRSQGSFLHISLMVSDASLMMGCVCPGHFLIFRVHCSLALEVELIADEGSGGVLSARAA